MPPSRMRRSSRMSPHIPAAAQDIAREGVRRLGAYQNPLTRGLSRASGADRGRCEPAPQGKLLRETARHLAVRMSYEDVVRVAQAKIGRRACAASHARNCAWTERALFGGPGPRAGIEELPAAAVVLARPILALAESKGWLGRVHFGMEINSPRSADICVSCCSRRCALSGPMAIRYAQEQAADRKLARPHRQGGAPLTRACTRSRECARLIKGYGDTHARGLANYAAIEAGRSARRSAGAPNRPRGRCRGQCSNRRAGRPEGESLARCLTELDGRAAFREAAE